MRLFKQQRKISFNWKYILGEILLIFFGITLAVWFNNWNADRKTTQEKEVAIVRIKEELQDNLKELLDAQQKNQPVIEGIQAFFGDSKGLSVSPLEMKALQERYPDVLLIQDSTAQGNGRYSYEGQTDFNLQFPDLIQIAWETTRVIGATKEFNYDCLYDIEKVYNLQRLFQTEIEVAMEATRQGDMSSLVKVLKFSQQFYPQLEEAYQKTIIQIDNCH